MKRKGTFKKHHFWFLLGVVPFCTLLGAVMISSSVGTAIDTKKDEVKKKNDSINQKKNPKSEQLMTATEKVIETVSGKLGEFHNDNWSKQHYLFTWPNDNNVLTASQQKNMKFGTDLTSLGLTDIFTALQNRYHDEYTNRSGTGMTDKVAPTQFKDGGWQNVLRHVMTGETGFGQKTITSNQTWLLLEDMWVQRSLLEGVQTLNKELATFERVVDPKVPDSKTKRVFRNRVWELALEVVKDGGTPRLAGTLTNISDRMQLMGTKNEITFNIWFDKDRKRPPMVFKLGGEYLPGKGATKVVIDQNKSEQVEPANVYVFGAPDSHLLPPGTPENLEIAAVEQVFDIRTVPLKRIDALVVGHKTALDNRNADKTLKAPLFFPPEPEATPATPGQPGAPPMPPVVTMPPGGPMVSSGPNATAQGTSSGGGALFEVTEGNKNRYIEVTPQVRRMPVAIVVIVDQAYIQDVLLAFANSPLRFQITQVTWTRYRGPLEGLTPSGGSTGFGSGIAEGGPGLIGGGFDGRRGAVPPIPPPVPRPMTNFGGPPMGGYSGVPGQSVVSDSQITSGLVKLSVYGIVSLYEKFEEAKPSDPAKPNDPVTPMPVTPNNQTTPKMRRRVSNRLPKQAG